VDTDKSNQTKSEVLFLDYCGLRGYAAKRISQPEDSGRFPDYEVLIDKNRIIVEVKELCANPEDEKVAKSIEENRIELLTYDGGRRVRTHIEDAERQLRRYENEHCPSIIVLYDNITMNGSPVHPTDFCIHPLAPYSIDVGMFGLHAANVRIHPDGRTESLGDTRASGRTLRDTKRTLVSAVAVLYEFPDYGLRLAIYHNYYAQNPLPKSLFIDPKDCQFEKPDHPEQCPGAWNRVQS